MEMEPGRLRLRRSNPISIKVSHIYLCLLFASSLFNVFILSYWLSDTSHSATTPTNCGPPILRGKHSSETLRDRNSRKKVNVRSEVETDILEMKQSTNTNTLENKNIDGGILSSNSDLVLKVHLWDDSTQNGYREKTLYGVEGFSNHPRTRLVNSPHDADLIVWTSVRSEVKKEIPPRNYSNVVLLDYADGCSAHQKRGQLKHMIGYFKRSFVLRDKNGVYERNCTREPVRGGIFPFAYSGLEALVNKDVNKKRNTLITNVLRTEKKANTVRAKIVNWTSSFIEHHGLKNVSNVGDVTNDSRKRFFGKRYLDHLADSKIIVTCNPWNWEGDFRLWEALLSGALVMVDRMAIPQWMPHPFVHKKHLVYYDVTNQTEFNSLLEYYVTHEDEARRIGKAGYDFVLKHHMAKDRVSYILDKIESRIVLDRDASSSTHEATDTLPQPKAEETDERCTFCERGMLQPCLVVPAADGNTCQSIQSIADRYSMSSDLCAIIKKQEMVCCPENDDSKKYNGGELQLASAVLNSKIDCEL